MFHIQVKDKLFGEDWLKNFVAEILDAKYEKTDVVEVMKGLTHLNTHQKADLLWVLQENKKMFDETLDVYPHKKGIIPVSKLGQVSRIFFWGTVKTRTKRADAAQLIEGKYQFYLQSVVEWDRQWYHSMGVFIAHSPMPYSLASNLQFLRSSQ